MIIKIFIWFFLFLTLSTGFRTYPGVQVWDIDNSSTTNAKLFFVYTNGARVVANDVDSDHSLYGTSTVTVEQMMQAIFSDYNSIQSAYVTLVSSSDADFASRGTDRTITLVDGNPGGVQAGVARFTTNSNHQINECTVTLGESVYDSSKTFLGVVGHEIGHCLGLDHPQDTVYALMSYYRAGIYQLDIDDKIGLVNLYPVNSSDVQEVQTLGLSCTRKN